MRANEGMRAVSVADSASFAAVRVRLDAIHFGNDTMLGCVDAEESRVGQSGASGESPARRARGL